MRSEATAGALPRIPDATSVAGTRQSPRAAELAPVLVLGGGLAALGVVRALGRAGIPLHVATAHPGPARRSRWYRPPPFGDLLYHPGDLAEYLHRSPLEKAVLVPTSDDDALAVARLPEELKKRFPSSLAPEWVLDCLIDKAGFAGLLDRCGVPHPRTIVVEGPEDLARIRDIEAERAFIKPRDSEAFVRRFSTNALRPSGPLDLKGKLEWLMAQGIGVVVQEYVPGPPANHYFVEGFMDAQGVVRARFARRRLRMFPRDFGSSSAVTTIEPDRIMPAVRSLERLLEQIGYRGMYSAEFKLDERDGTFRLLEVDPRAWSYVEFAIRCGVDVVRMGYEDALDLPVTSAFSYPVGRKLVYAPYDAAAWRTEDGAPASARDGFDYLRTLLEAEWAVFAGDDPLPGIADLAAMAKRRFGRWLPWVRGRRGDGQPTTPIRVSPASLLSGWAARAGRREEVSPGPEGPGSPPSVVYPRFASPSNRRRREAARSS